MVQETSSTHDRTHGQIYKWTDGWSDARIKFQYISRCDKEIDRTVSGFVFSAGHKQGEILANIETAVSLPKLGFLLFSVPLTSGFMKLVKKKLFKKQEKKQLEYKPLVTADLNMTTVARVTRVSL